MIDGTAVACIENMRIARAVTLEENPVIAGGGQPLSAKTDNPLHGAQRGGPFDADAPDAALCVVSPAAQLAADFDEVIVDPDPFQMFGNLVDTETLGDAGKIDPDVASILPRAGGEAAVLT